MNEREVRKILDEVVGHHARWQFGHAGRHPFVLLEGPLGSRKISYSGSNLGDWRAIHNFRALLKRSCRDIGLELSATKRRKPMAETALGEQLRDKLGLGQPVANASDSQSTKASEIKPATAATPARRATAKRRAYKSITFSDVARIGALLQQHARQEDGFAVYAEGWSDERIMVVVGGNTTVEHVQKIRRDLFGFTKAESAQGKAPEPDLKFLSRMICELQARIAKLEQRADDIEAAVTKP